MSNTHLTQKGLRHAFLLPSFAYLTKDRHGRGKITIQDFENNFDDEAVVAFFASIEISAMDAWTLFLTLDVDGDHTVGPDFALSIFKSWMRKKCRPVQCHRRISNSCQMARWFRFVSSLVLVCDGILDTIDPPCNFL